MTSVLIFAQAKTTKKVVLRLECTSCKYKMQLTLKRCKQYVLLLSYPNISSHEYAIASSLEARRRPRVLLLLS
jgi:hypothetical protein